MLPDEYHRREEEVKHNLLGEETLSFFLHVVFSATLFNFESIAGSQDDGSEIPVFVCTMSYPQVIIIIIIIIIIIMTYPYRSPVDSTCSSPATA